MISELKMQQKKGIVSKTRRSSSQEIEKIIQQHEQSALEEISLAQSRQRTREKEQERKR